jgi:hypothetical protein
MSVTRFTAAIVAWVLVVTAAPLLLIGCSGSASQSAAAATTRGLADLQEGMTPGNPPAWYTEKLADLGFEVKTLRYERSDLLAYDVARGAAAFHIELALDPETATASKVEIEPVRATQEAAVADTSPRVDPAEDASSPAVVAGDEDEMGETSSPAADAAPVDDVTPPASAATPPAPAATSPEPEPMVALPAGTLIATRLNDPLDSGTAQVGDRFSMMVPEPVSLAGITVLPAGSRIRGYVAEVQKARRPNGAGRLTLKAEQIEANGTVVEFEGLVTAEGERLEGESSTREDLKEIAVGAGVGGLVGGLLGGGKGVVAGILIGGGGTFVATKGEEVRLPADTPLYVELREEVSVPVRR